MCQSINQHVFFVLFLDFLLNFRHSVHWGINPQSKTPPPLPWQDPLPLPPYICKLSIYKLSLSLSISDLQGLTIIIK